MDYSVLNYYIISYLLMGIVILFGTAFVDEDDISPFGAFTTLSLGIIIISTLNLFLANYFT